MGLRELTTVTTTGLEILLSPLVEDDIERVYELCQDPQIQHWTTVPSPYPYSAAEGFVRDYTAPAWRQIDEGSFTTQYPGPELVWGIRVNKDSALSGLWGCIGLMLLGEGRVEIGWWLGAEVRQRGIARAAVRTGIEAAFSEEFPIRASCIVWHAFIGNLASAALAQRHGFRYTGIVEPDSHLRERSWSAQLCCGDPIAPRGDWPDLS